MTIKLFAGLAITLTFNAFNVLAEEPLTKHATAVFAGGCFWCIESDYEKLEGVIEAVSGYTGGSAETATYKQVGSNQTGHYEALQVTYDPAKISYAELVEFFWRHIDPTDAGGQFCDRGESYRSALFYASEAEHQIALMSKQALANQRPFEQPVVTPLKEATPFYPAEDYHQDYYKKNPLRYKYYRFNCGRDARVKKLWGDESITTKNN